MEPYIAMIDFRVFNDHAFLELSTDAQSRFAQLIGTCDRMGTANLYQIWNNSRIKPTVMTSLYESGLVWEVDAYYCFIPSVFYANNKIRSGKYKAGFDVKGFQACINRYPEILKTMSETETSFIRSYGVILPDVRTSDQIRGQKSQSISIANPIPEENFYPEEDYIEFCGEMIHRREYWKCTLLKSKLSDLNQKYDTEILTEAQVNEWFLDKYHRHYVIDGKKINDLVALFTSYCESIVFNKRAQGILMMPARASL